MDDKKAIINRLKRLNGQVNGLINLIEKEEECQKVFVQFQAVKSAINGAFAQLLKLHLKACSQKNDQQSLEHIIGLLTRE